MKIQIYEHLESLEARQLNLGLYTTHITAEDLADLYDKLLDNLEVERVWNWTGETYHGYVELGKAANQMVDEALGPFLWVFREIC